jgi:membrane protease YdiL (CAAX protease family)
VNHEDGQAAPQLTLIEGILLFLLSLGLLIGVGLLSSHLRLGPQGVALTQLIAVLAPALLFARARLVHVLLWTFSPTGAETGPTRPQQLAAALAGGALLGGAWFYLLSVLIEPLCERIYPMPAWERRALMQLLLPAGGPRPLWQDLLYFAVLPALCEEILFRGVLLRALIAGLRRAAATLAPRRRLTTAAALLLTSLLFGAFHLSPSRFIPTTLLGLGFGAVTLAAGSLWASVAMHLCNNTLVLLLLRTGRETPPPPSQGGAASLLPLLALAAACLGALLVRRARTAVMPPPSEEM